VEELVAWAVQARTFDRPRLHLVVGSDSGTYKLRHSGDP
jgi:hypothetical protein